MRPVHLNDVDRSINATTISKTNRVMVQLQHIAADILHMIGADTNITNLPRTQGDDIFRQSYDYLCNAIYDVAPKRKYETICNTIANKLYKVRRERQRRNNNNNDDDNDNNSNEADVGSDV